MLSYLEVEYTGRTVWGETIEKDGDIKKDCVCILDGSDLTDTDDVLQLK